MIRFVLIAVIISITAIACKNNFGFGRSAVIARIDNTIITVGEFEDFFKLRIGEYANSVSGADHMTLKYYLLNQMIEEEIVLDVAKKEKIEIPEYQIDQEVARFKQQFKTEEEFMTYLKNNAMSISDFRQSLNKLTIIRLVEEKKVYESINVTDKEIYKYYFEHQNEYNLPESVLVRELIFNSLEEAQKVVDRLAKGEAFDDIAAAIKGNLEEKQEKMYTKDELPATFSKELFALGTGRYSTVLEDEHGKFHLFQLKNKRYPKIVEYDAVKDAIKVTVLLQKRELRYNQWINSKKKQYVIHINEDYFKKIK